MTIKIIASKDFLFIRSKRRTIVMCGYLIGKKHSTSVQPALNKILTFLHNTKQSYSLSISTNYTRLYVYFVLPTIEEAVLNLRKFLANFAIIERFNDSIVISPLNYSHLREELEQLLSPIKTTSDPRIFEINKHYISAASIILHSTIQSSFQEFLKLLIKNAMATVSISRFNSNHANKKTQYHNRILLKIRTKSFLEAQTSLKNLEEVLTHFKDQMSLTIHFQTLKYLKKQQLQFALGIGHKDCKIFDWFDSLNFSEYLHDFSVANVPKTIIKNEKSDAAPFSQVEKVEITQKHCEPLNKAKSSNNIKNSYEPLIPYGKKLSKEQIKRMIDTIPLPP